MVKLILFLFMFLSFSTYIGADTENSVKVMQHEKSYIVTIKNNEGKILFKNEYSSSPIITNYNDNLTGIKISLGNPNSQTVFYDKENNKVSVAFENVFAVEADRQYVIYSENNKVAFNYIFSKDKPIFIIRDYSPTASIYSAINEVKFIGSGKLKMSYMVGSDFTDKEETIEIKTLLSEKTGACP